LSHAWPRGSGRHTGKTIYTKDGFTDYDEAERHYFEMAELFRDEVAAALYGGDDPKPN